MNGFGRPPGYGTAVSLNNRIDNLVVGSSNMSRRKRGRLYDVVLTNLRHSDPSPDMPTLHRLSILLASARPTGNGVGLVAWLKKHHLESLPASKDWSIDVKNLATPPLPLGVVTSNTLPAMIANGQYESAAVREWSTYVRDSTAFVVVTPEYNWSYPGELKNAFDIIYSEWNDKPVALLTYGVQGGKTAAAHLRTVMGSGLKMKIVSEVNINLPGPMVHAAERVSDNPAFLDAYSADVRKALSDLLDASKIKKL